MDYPKISICMPIYNRTEFKPLIVYNLINLNYPDKKLLQFCIDDDGTDKLFKDKLEETEFENSISPISLKYYYTTHKRTIGEKRNNLIKISSHKLIACMDSDDIYLPQYLTHSVNKMKELNVSCVGTNEMLFLFPEKDWLITAIRCEAKRQIHEASCLFTKKHARSMGGFKKNSRGEGAKMVDYNDKNVGLTQIQDCMICICHNNNTVNKDMFLDKQQVVIDLPYDLQNIISIIFNITHELNNFNPPVK